MSLLPRWTLLCACLALAACATAPDRSPAARGLHELPESEAAGAPSAVHAAADEGHGVGHTLLFYIPNRIFDVFDIVRARVRVGPGFGFTARATELADVKFGSWVAIYAGIHGPRSEPSIPWPIGLETYAGVGVSVLEVEADELHYGRTEFGLGLHLLLVGFDLGLDPLEIADFAVGLFTLDLVHDDY